MAKKSKKYYVVKRGRTPGIFDSWPDCERAIKGYGGALFKSYPSRAEAEAAFKLSPEDFKASLGTGQSSSSSPQVLSFSSPKTIVLPSISVDAACAGNPGLMEYQGVDTKDGRLLFHQGPFDQGTNNLGEFLAIVHGLAFLKSQGSELPIYTDSQVAMKWVRTKEVKTTVPRTTRNEEIFTMVEQAIAWLNVHRYNNQILKWETKQWGQIPADFGRK
ncbi:MAG: ribonuclease H [Synechococcaceae cyanobacterium RL_1_2]|nr:ribonuclease H [Synechococcaceae cyanobacterium RL_1_2]